MFKNTSINFCKNSDKVKIEKNISRIENKKLKGEILNLYKSSLKLTEIQREIIIGTLLGDATIPKQKKGNNYNIKFEQTLKNEEYIHHLYYIFSIFVGTGPKIRNIKSSDVENLDRYSI